MSWFAKIVLTGAVVEGAVAVVAFAMAGVTALAASLVGSAVALGAQVAAVASLRPGMKAPVGEFSRRFVASMAARAVSFAIVAAAMIGLKTVLPPIWVAAGYLTVLLSLLFAETKFLK
ncbi:MAG: hypothetical protein AABY85_01645 [Gemmatimonadota bacterium]